MGKDETMKSVNIFARGSVGMVCEPVPEPADDQVLCRVKCAGLCGTDYGIFSGEFENRVRFPLRPGHEWSGVVVKTGRDIKNLVPGDRVVGESSVSCGVCENCAGGDKLRCTALRSVGTVDDVWPGAMAEYVVYPARDLIKLPGCVSFEQAALAEPAANALMGVENAPVLPQSTVAIMGTGPIGIAAAAFARLYGAKQVISVGRSPFKLELCRKLGATHTINTREIQNTDDEIMRITEGRGVDVSIELSGAPDLFKTCVKVTKQKGVLMLLAFYNGSIELDVNSIVLAGLTLKTAGGGWGYFEKVLGYMQKGLDLTPLITSRIPLEQAPQEIAGLKTGNAEKIKVMIVNP